MQVRTIKQHYQELSITAKATLWFILCSIVQKAILIITTPIFTRIMSTKQYGEYTMYTSWLQIFLIVATLKLNGGGFNKAMSKFSDRRDDYVASLQTVTTVLTGVLLIIYYIFRKPVNSFTELGTVVTIGILIEIIFQSAISFWTIRNRYEYQYKAVVFVTLLIAVFNLLFGLIAVLLTKEEKGIARILSCIFVQVAVGFIIYIKNYQKARNVSDRDLIIYALQFSIPLLPHYFSMYILEQSDRVMIQKMCGFSYAALYGVAYSAGLLLKIVTESTTNALIPWMYEKLEKKDVASIRKKFMPIFFMVVLMLTLFISFAPDIIMILAGEKYKEAIYVIPPVTASIFFIFIYSIFANIEFFYEKKNYTMYISTSGAILNLILNYLLIRVFGFVAAAYTTLICYAYFAIGHWVFASVLTKKNCGVPVFDTGTVLIPSCIIVMFTIVMSILFKYTAIRYIMTAVLLTIIVIQRNDFITIIKQLKK